MTREEAIDNLQDLWNEVYNEDSDGYTYAVAIDMAIEALKGGDAEMSPLQKPTTTPMQQSPSDGADLISREDAIEVVEKEDCLGYIECKAEKIYDRINAIPSVDRPHGEWIEFVSQVDGRFKECNQCGERIYLSTFYENDYNYCPNCGADMRGEST